MNTAEIWREGAEVIGMFYNSRDGMYHLARYVPYQQPPVKYLCGKVGNFSPTQGEGRHSKCADCWACK